MRKCRLIETGRCYHLISRIAHRAFFLTPDERTRTVDLIRRVEEFSGVLVLAYAVMTNHIHIYIYVPEAESCSYKWLLRAGFLV
jgi:REP element-mobilizing transposase RayT